MNVLVTGGTGFVGCHLVRALLDRGHQVSVVGRRDLRHLAWKNEVTYHACDIGQAIDRPFEALGRPDAVIHLAWSGLPNYDDALHIHTNLPTSQRFLGAMLEGGLRHLMVAGTCFEYGMLSGALTEDMSAEPTRPYAVAKDLLRRSLEGIRLQRPFILQWVRLFYVHGSGQNPRSLLSSLDHAIDSGATDFDMSEGAQIRDFIPVTDAVNRMATLLVHPECDGIINICSGTPVSILEVVKCHLKTRNAAIGLNLGRLPYAENEPMAFWGDDSKFQRYCTDQD